MCLYKTMRNAGMYVENRACINTSLYYLFSMIINLLLRFNLLKEQEQAQTPAAIFIPEPVPSPSQKLETSETPCCRRGRGSSCFCRSMRTPSSYWHRTATPVSNPQITRNWLVHKYEINFLFNKMYLNVNETFYVI